MDDIGLDRTGDRGGNFLKSVDSILDRIFDERRELIVLARDLLVPGLESGLGFYNRFNALGLDEKRRVSCLQAAR